MTFSISRRTALVGSLLAVSSALSPGEARTERIAIAQARLRELERENGGRLGVCVLDLTTNDRIEHRADERFALCSTFKFLAASLVLARVDREEEKLERRVAYSKADLVPYSPITEIHVGEIGMTLGELCEAAMTVSDNTAGNLLLASFGGPAGLTAYARSLGDDLTRFDRIETALNEATPGDARDTTTPAAMAENIKKLVLGDALSKPSRDRLTAWLIANKTGDKRLRAGIPKDWRVGDKTGSGNNGAVNDIAVVWPPDRKPLIVSAYFAESQLSSDSRNAVLAQVGRIVVG